MCFTENFFRSDKQKTSDKFSVHCLKLQDFATKSLAPYRWNWYTERS